MFSLVIRQWNASMRAVVNVPVAAATLRVDALPSAQLICRTNNFPNASGCLQRTGSSFHRAVKTLDAGRQVQHYQRLHSSAFACRCLASSGGSEDNVHGHGGADEESEDQAGPTSYVWDFLSRHQRMQVCFLVAS